MDVKSHSLFLAKEYFIIKWTVDDSPHWLQVDWIQTDRHFEVALFKPSPLGWCFVLFAYTHVVRYGCVCSKGLRTDFYAFSNWLETFAKLPLAKRPTFREAPRLEKCESSAAIWLNQVLPVKKIKGKRDWREQGVIVTQFWWKICRSLQLQKGKNWFDLLHVS